MIESSDRILTTHVGSLPRSPELVDLLVERHRGAPIDQDQFRERVTSEMAAAVEHQLDVGIDIGGDGELARVAFAIYAKDRLSGFGGSAITQPIGDLVRFPAYARLKRYAVDARGEVFDQLETPSFHETPAATGEVAYDPELSAVGEELAMFAAALERTGGEARFAETFITAASPGAVVTALLRDPENPVYASDEEYLFAVAEAMRSEYECIVEQGHVLQLDSPDLAMERDFMYRERPLSDFLEAVDRHVEALNRAISNIPPDRVRLHVCWGNYDGPHVADVELSAILPLIYEAKVGAITLPCGNPRHSHEHRELRAHPLPEGCILAVGAIDTTTNYVEHPEVVADRLATFAEAVGGPERIIASTDCGLSTFAGFPLVAEDVAWRKLRSLSEGAALASERLY
jgi:5-methyltetrahydropteroyltriglutamate--homocysteine methyltransferase